jgi:hypothetical protein
VDYREECFRISKINMNIISRKVTHCESPKPKVTIGIPFYNSSHTLVDTIRSVFAQTFQHWEMILIDDGSTDDSVALARKIQDQRVTVLSDGKNLKSHIRHNQISQLARGDYIAKLDADDLMVADRLQIQVDFMDSHPEIALIGSGAYAIDETNRCYGLRGLEQTIIDRPNALKRSPFIQPTLMGRTEWFISHPYDPGFTRAEDQELWCRTCQSSNFAIVPVPLLFYRDPMEVNLSKYLSTCVSVRRIFRKYGPTSVGKFRTMSLIAQSHCKAWIFRLFCSLGMAHRIVRMRYRGLTKAEEQKAADDLEMILATPVPGIDC